MNRYSAQIIMFLILISSIIATSYIYLKKKTILAFDLNKTLDKKNIIPVAVIGSGPAGLSAALYTSRAGIYTVLFQGPKPGGQLTDTTYVENWPGTKKMLGTELIEQNKQQAEKFGTIISNDSIECVDFTKWPYRLQTSEGHELNALSIVIATGSKPRLLEVPGEKEYWAYGVTTCAVCDAPFYKNKDVVVVGGGDSAVEEATLLASYANNVKILVRDKMRAATAMQERLKGYKNIEVILNTSIKKINGDNKFVNEVELINNKNKDISKLKVSGVFIAIGHIPNTEIFKEFISLDKFGYIKLYKNQETSKLGIFAAGDVTDNRYMQAGTSAGDGIKAGLDAVFFLQDIGYNELYNKKIENNLYDPDQDKQIDIKKITSNKEFDDLIKKYKVIVLEFGAKYCNSCKTLLSYLKSIASKLENKVAFAQVDLDDDPKELKSRFDVKSIPLLLIFKDSKLVIRHEKDLISKFKLYNIINNILNQN